jgi:predicted porin
LEKIEMKKTLVAVAAMAAVTGAMADVTLSGNFDQAYTTTKTNTSSKVTNIGGSGMGSNALGDTFITFAGSEDLGGGMKASFKIEPQLSPNGAAHSMGNREAWLGLSGGFGSVNVGNNYAPAFLLFGAATDPNGVSNGFGHVGWDSGTGMIGAGASSISYTLPSLMSGLNVGLSKTQGGSNSQSATASGAGDAQSYAFAYNISNFTAGFSSQTTKNSKLAYTSASLTPVVVESAAAGTSLKTTNTGLIYNAGVAQLSYLATKSSLKADSISTGTFGISVPVGAVTVGYTTGDMKAVDGGVQSKFKGNQLVVSYALSKRTKTYFQSGAFQTSGAVTASKTSQSGIGIAHAF